MGLEREIAAFLARYWEIMQLIYYIVKNPVNLRFQRIYYDSYNSTNLVRFLEDLMGGFGMIWQYLVLIAISLLAT